ncbi:MAG: sugar phosphate isomerase/epimerase [Deltaproteobacteria bacterium]|nr:sugar phosphate isomerase/epimerase [Deltaproteobacteria bacterium]
MGEGIRIGNQTAFHAPPLEPFRYAVSRGFDAFEWFPDKRESGAGWTETDLGPESRAWIRETARERGIRLSVHAPWYASPVEERGFELLAGSVSFAEEIGAALVNIHLAPRGDIRAFATAVLPLLDRVGSADLRLSLENTPETGPADFEALFEELEGQGASAARAAGLCLDVGHANLWSGSRNNYLRFVDLCMHVPIIHVHLHENYGDADTHLPAFTGPSALDPSGMEGLVSRLKRRAFRGSVILEQWPQPPELLDRARARLLELFASSG